jgi:iron complex outermembrane receptor protein
MATRTLSHRLSFAIALLCAGTLRGQAPTPPDLTQASLEDLMDIKVTSVSKKEQKLSTAGAAVFVITQEDIRRSGATNIPDVLRMAPGVNVAQINASTWAISIRGFADIYADKVLVLIDGRTVYDPTSSGVNWDQQDVPLEDIERVEVIRGPGGTVWGSNAVNGVINITTKSSKATQGGLISATAGTQTVAQGLVQYGGTIGDKGAYRAFAHYFDNDSSTFANGAPSADSWGMLHGGFRSDWQLGSRDTLTVQGDLLRSRLGEITKDSSGVTQESSGHVDSGDILSRWNHTFSDRSATSLQVYYDHGNRDLLPYGVDQFRDTIDVDFNHHIAVSSWNDIVWGAGFRSTSDQITPGKTVSFIPSHQRDNLFSAFLQDQIRLTSTLSLTLGSKFEDNPFTGYEDEPSGQLVWQVKPEHTVWFSAGKAVRQPSRADEALQVGLASIPLSGGATGILTLFGSRTIAVEQLRDFEAGYRTQVSKHISLDLTAFLSHYRDLRTQEPGAPYFVTSPAPHLVIPLTFDDLAHGSDYGGEASATWMATSHWKMVAAYSQLRMNILRDPNSLDTTVQQLAGLSPAHQFQIRSLVNPRPRWEWDSSLAYTGRLTTTNVPGVARLDTRIGWHATESLEFSLVGQNLLSPGHIEYIGTNEPTISSLVRRNVFGKITWRF